jgi:hypothetical protein
MNEYEKAFKRLLRNKYNSNTKLVFKKGYGLYEKRYITKKKEDWIRSVIWS